MNSVLSVIFVDQNNLHNLNSAINNIKISGNDIYLANLDQVHIKINENSPQLFDINTKVNSAQLETINSQNVSIEMKGTLKLDNKVLNGNLNILIKDLKTNEDIFNLPFNIKDNQVIFLFMNIFDLNKILFFL
jgi:phosphopantetheine adenylyltransferase